MRQVTQSKTSGLILLEDPFSLILFRSYISLNTYKNLGHQYINRTSGAFMQMRIL